MTHYNRYLTATFVVYMIYLVVWAAFVVLAPYVLFETFECRQRERTAHIEENT